MTDSGPALPKRFYEVVDAVPVEDGFAIHLDGKSVRTPIGNFLVLPVQPLAEAVAEEWRAQEETIDPASMALCGLANTAIDRVGTERQTVIANMMNFAETDLLCYRAEPTEELANRQHENWQPLLDWAAESLGVHLKVTSGILPIEQPAEALEAINARLSELSDLELTAVASLAAACSSLILALALAANRIDAGQAFTLSHLDETFQNERRGQDSEANARRNILKDDIASSAYFLKLLRP